MLPSRDLCDSEMTRSLEFGEVCSPVWIADPGDKKLGLNIHHCPGGWSVPIPPIRHLHHRKQRGNNVEFVSLQNFFLLKYSLLVWDDNNLQIPPSLHTSLQKCDMS